MQGNPDELHRMIRNLLENAVNYAVRNGWCYDTAAGEVSCRPSVRALLDPRLREQLLPFEESYASGTLRAGRVRATVTGGRLEGGRQL